MSILPRVETSQTPTLARTAFTSRVDGLAPVRLARLSEPLRAQPLTRFNESRAALLCPSVTRGQSRRLEVLATMMDPRARRSRRVYTADERRSCRLRAMVRSVSCGKKRETVDVGSLALIGAPCPSVV